MRKDLIGKLAAGLFVLLAAAVFSGVWAHGGDDQGQGYQKKKAHKVDLDEHGAVRLYDDEGKLIKVLVPARNERAKEAVRNNKGKAESGCPAPAPLMVQDLLNVSDAISAPTGLFIFYAYDPGFGRVILGFYEVEGNGQFTDGFTAPASAPLSMRITIANDSFDTITIAGGDSLSLVYDAGSATITFPIAVTVPAGTSQFLYTDATGRLYWDEALTQPLDSQPVGCP
ncbi:MAG: hypothetical protein HY401_07050 [Elusimicrobia bacterium]|nr:hypothetical protein [Elusimicrobiota bacterium]